MASTGTALYPGSTTFPGSSTYPGQGPQPRARIRLSTDDASVAIPTWTDVTNDVRSFSVSRGRENELTEFDAGSCTVTLDNRDRAYDPNNTAAIKPLNRWWIEERFSGESHDLFKGYAESYDNQWPGGGFDAECVVSCADEFKLLNLQHLPVMNPPRDTYADVVQFDNPASYWSFSDVSLVRTLTTEGYEVVGFGDWTVPSPGGFGIANDTPIVGDPVGSTEDGSGGCLFMQAGHLLGNNDTSAGDALGGSYFAVEHWAKFTSPSPAATYIAGPLAASFSPSRIWTFAVSTTGVVTFQFIDSAGVTKSVTTSALGVTGVWHHIVGVIDGSNLRIYVDGALANTTAGLTNPIASAISAPNMSIAGPTTSGTIAIDELAVYNRSSSLPFDVGRVSAHYQAGVARGFPSELPGARVVDVVTALDSQVPLSIFGNGTRTMHPTFMRGQSPLDELKLAARAEAPDGALFMRADGSLVFLDAAHRSSSPYNTSQVTIGDGTGEVPYSDLNVDYSDSFLSNEINVTRQGRGGVLQTVSDSTSISRYLKRPTSVTDVPVLVNSAASAIAAAMLAKYKDPMQRVTGVTFDTVLPEVTEAVFRRELMDKITVKRTPPGGGSRISQDLFIQKIEVQGANDGKPWSIRWGVSPL